MRSRKRSPWRSMTFAMRRTSTRSEPMPIIMARTIAATSGPQSCRHLRSSTAHRLVHAPYGLSQADEGRLPDQEMADVELDYFRQRRDHFCARIVQPVPGMDFEAEAFGELGALPDARPLCVRG